MDIIVTTPKSQMANAAQEAADCRAAGGGEYFRRFSVGMAPTVEPGDRVYYVEDGFIRGFALVKDILEASAGMTCDTTGREWPPGFYVFMDATSWQWVRPIPMCGFQGYRYPGGPVLDGVRRILVGGKWHAVEVVGGWLDPKPEVALG